MGSQGRKRRARSIRKLVSEFFGQPQPYPVSQIFRNNRNGTFSDETKRLGPGPALLCQGANYGDLDNDDWLDFYIGNGSPDFRDVIPNRMFRNDQGRRFQDVTFSGGFGNTQKGHDIAFADMDNDGDQDIYAVMGGAYSGDVYPNLLFQNPGHGNHWINLKLEGRKSNRSAIGAGIKITVGTQADRREIHRIVSSGGSFGANSLQQEIGLGSAEKIEKLEIFWPTSGMRQRFTNVDVDAFYHLREGDETLRRVEVKTATFSESKKMASQDPYEQQ